MLAMLRGGLSPPKLVLLPISHYVFLALSFALLLELNNGPLAAEEELLRRGSKNRLNLGY